MLKHSWNPIFRVALIVAIILPAIFFWRDQAHALGELDRIAGSNRIKTAIGISQRLFVATDSAGAVILARHDNFADALAANSLAGLSGGPILLTPGQKPLDTAVKAEIDRLLTPGKTVYIAGGTSALPSSIDAALKNNYKIVRLAGSDRYDTAAKIKSRGDALRGSAATEAIITRGDNFPDALSASSYSAFSGSPIILVKKDQIPAATKSLLTPTIKSSYLVGGTAAITDNVKNQIESLTANLTSRIWGANRYATSSAVADFFFASPVAISVATGTDYPDALAGGVLAGLTKLSISGTPLVLTKPNVLASETVSYLKKHAATIDDTLSGYLFGGSAAISSDTELTIESLI